MNLQNIIRITRSFIYNGILYINIFSWIWKIIQTHTWEYLDGVKGVSYVSPWGVSFASLNFHWLLSMVDGSYMGKIGRSGIQVSWKNTCLILIWMGIIRWNDPWWSLFNFLLETLNNPFFDLDLVWSKS